MAARLQRSDLLTMPNFNVVTVMRVEAFDSDDAQATVNAFLQRDDGELDDGTAIVAWRFPIPPIESDDDALSIPGIADGEVGRNHQKTTRTKED